MENKVTADYLDEEDVFIVAPVEKKTDESQSDGI